MKPIKKVIIKDEKYEDGYSELLAKISEKGDLVIDGSDKATEVGTSLN